MSENLEQPEVVIDTTAPELAQIEKVVKAWRKIVSQAAGVQGSSEPVTTRARITAGSVCFAPEARTRDGAAPQIDACVRRWSESLADEVLPEDMPNDAADAFIALGAASVEDAPVYVCQRGERTDARVIAERARALISNATFTAGTSIDGVIEALNEHARPITFKVYDVLQPKRGMRCWATPKAYESWRTATIDMLHGRDLVTVEGEGTFVRNELKSIAVHTITRRPEAEHPVREIIGALEGYRPIPRSDW